MESILNYVEESIDHDDMSRCAKTFEETDTYRRTHEFFDHFVDYYTELHYLYILKPMPPSQKDVEPWHRYSAAVGMAVYRPGKDRDVEAVLKRADSKMYAAKKAFKRSEQEKKS